MLLCFGIILEFIYQYRGKYMEIEYTVSELIQKAIWLFLKISLKLKHLILLLKKYKNYQKLISIRC